MKTDIQRLGYQPQAPYQLDLEVFSVGDLRRRGKEQVRVTHRYEFHTLVCVTQGTCTQMVDFKSISCEPGSLLVVQCAGRTGGVYCTLDKNGGQGEIKLRLVAIGRTAVHGHLVGAGARKGRFRQGCAAAFPAELCGLSWSIGATGWLAP